MVSAMLKVRHVEEWHLSKENLGPVNSNMKTVALEQAINLDIGIE
jgi:hypothetical protein